MDADSLWVEVIGAKMIDGEMRVTLGVGSIRWDESGVGVRADDRKVYVWPFRMWDSTGKLPRIEEVPL